MTNEGKKRVDKTADLQDWRKTHHPCHICDQQAVGCYRPDLDIKGLCFCEEHKEQIQFAYFSLLNGDVGAAKEFLGNKKYE